MFKWILNKFKKKDNVKLSSFPVEKTRDQLDKAEWVPEIQNSEWVEGVHPDVLEFRRTLRQIRMAALGVLASGVIYFIGFCGITFLFNLVFSEEITMFLFGVKNINPLHALGVYSVYFLFKTIASFIDDEFSGFNFFVERDEDGEPLPVVPSEPDNDKVISQLRRSVKRQEIQIRKLKND